MMNSGEWKVFGSLNAWLGIVPIPVMNYEQKITITCRLYEVDVERR
jgi:hypothetical protein